MAPFIIATLFAVSASILGITARTGYEGQSTYTSNGQRGYEGQPGNQGGGNHGGQNGYEGRPGNQSGHRGK